MSTTSSSSNRSFIGFRFAPLQQLPALTCQEASGENPQPPGFQSQAGESLARWTGPGGNERRAITDRRRRVEKQVPQRGASGVVQNPSSPAFRNASVVRRRPV